MTRKSKNHLVPIPVDPLTTIAKAGQVLKAVIDKFPGGVEQDRFISRTQEVYDLLKKYGYPANGITYTTFKIGKSQVPDKKKGDATYSPEFERLRKYMIARLNVANPGLGDAYGKVYPAFELANKGNITAQPIKVYERFLQAYPPGSYKPAFQQIASAAINTAVQNQNTVQQIANTQTIQDSINKQIAMLDPVKPVMIEGLKSAGIVPPADPVRLAETFYNEIVAKATNSMESDNLDEPMTNAILGFIATIKAKSDAGEQLNPVYQKIANVTGKVQEKIESQVKTQTGNKIGNWLLDHPFESALILVVLFIIAKKVFKF